MLLLNVSSMYPGSEYRRGSSVSSLLMPECSFHVAKLVGNLTILCRNREPSTLVSRYSRERIQTFFKGLVRDLYTGCGF